MGRCVMNVVEHEGRIFFEAEHLINGLIDNLLNTLMETEVYGDEFSKKEYFAIQENMRGFSGAIKVIIDSYSHVTPLAERAEVMEKLSNQITNIINAPVLDGGK
jgi:hypothetical protein